MSQTSPEINVKIKSFTGSTLDEVRADVEQFIADTTTEIRGIHNLNLQGMSVTDSRGYAITTFYASVIYEAIPERFYNVDVVAFQTSDPQEYQAWIYDKLVHSDMVARVMTTTVVMTQGTIQYCAMIFRGYTV
jgi:hypothetical protein